MRKSTHMTNNKESPSEAPSSIFKDEHPLSMKSISNSLPHRNKELSLLSQLFLTLLTNPNEISRDILVTGKTEINKTVTVKFIGKLLIDAAKKKNMNIYYIHCECNIMRCSHHILTHVLTSLQGNVLPKKFPERTLMKKVKKYLNRQNAHLILTLENLHELYSGRYPLIKRFQRAKRISIIGITNKIDNLTNLEPESLQIFRRNIIRFESYTQDQFLDILKYRIELSLQKNVISEGVIELVSDIASKKNSLAFGLNVVWLAGIIAEVKGIDFINSECIKRATHHLHAFLL